jgi:hypothetical protein
VELDIPAAIGSPAALLTTPDEIFKLAGEMRRPSVAPLTPSHNSACWHCIAIAKKKWTNLRKHCENIPEKPCTPEKEKMQKRRRTRNIRSE